ncbi:unnamed protein product [Candidula unifasciata]|uniref:Chromo domain-containing protein n=1 Tax=Candidula unifasciata TaxID=100452 RepID=A0A8S3YHI9_9EUPU|nr:unnamed protein product [Candidula unifasciata]
MNTIDSILEQRKRKGLLEYLVRWKGSGDDVKGETWEPAKNLVNDYAKAVQSFTKGVKAQKAKRSSSRSSRASRSRSRSSSRSRKSGRVKEEARSQVQVEERQKAAVAEAESSQPTRSSRSRARVTAPQTTTNSLATAQVASKTELHTHSNSVGQGNQSDNMKTQQELEVQRVHNEQRPVREDDLKPRSAIWKVADYAVIVLFVLSLIAALFLFLEKFIDLDEFKKQAFPNFAVLQTRLEDVQQNLLELASNGAGRISDAWLYLIEQVKGSAEAKVETSQSKI